MVAFVWELTAETIDLLQSCLQKGLTPKPESRIPKPESRNPNPETPNPESRDPKPENRNPKPKTRFQVDNAEVKKKRMLLLQQATPGLDPEP